jgi:thioredoxin-related protein
MKEYDLELIIRFILKHNINKNSSLQLLILQNAHCAMINRLQKVIDREELIQNYSIEFIEGTAYLWL